jgi:hypothetical protein
MDDVVDVVVIAMLVALALSAFFAAEAGEAWIKKTFGAKPTLPNGVVPSPSDGDGTVAGSVAKVIGGGADAAPPGSFLADTPAAAGGDMYDSLAGWFKSVTGVDISKGIFSPSFDGAQAATDQSAGQFAQNIGQLVPGGFPDVPVNPQSWEDQ